MASVTAIEFTDLECKILQVERVKGKKPVLRTLVTFPLPKNNDLEARVAARAQMLKEALKNAKLNPQKVRIIVPKHYVVSRKVTLPSTVDEEIMGMARFEAERHIPFNAERHIVGHHVLSRQGMQGSEVLLAAIDQPAAQEFLDVCLRAGLNVDSLDVSTFALHRSFAASRPAAAPGQGNGVSAVINIGLAATEIVITQDGQLAYSRSASVGLAKLLDEAGAGSPDGGLNLRRLAEIDALQLNTPAPASSAFPSAPASSPAPVVVIPPAPAAYEGSPSAGNGTDGGMEGGRPAAAPSLPPVPGQAAAAAATAVATEEAPQGEAVLAPLTEPVHLPPPPVPAGDSAPSAPPVPVAQPVAEQAAPQQAAMDGALRQLFAGWQARLLKEVRTTYEFARREFNCPPITHFHVCGEGALIRNLPEALSKSFGVETSVFDPFSAVEVPAKAEASVNDRRPAHAALLGGVLTDAPNGVGINLLPNQYLDQKSAKRQQQSYMITGILALTALVLAYVWLKGVLDGQQARLDHLRSENSKMAAAVKELKEKQKRNDIVNTYVRDRKGAVEILDQLSSDTKFAFIPKNVALRGFEFTKDESVKISGYAMSLADANRMRQALEDTDYFEQVKEVEGHNQMTRLPRRDVKTSVYQISLEGTFPKPKKKSSTPAKPAAADEE